MKIAKPSKLNSRERCLAEWHGLTPDRAAGSDAKSTAQVLPGLFKWILRKRKGSP